MSRVALRFKKGVNGGSQDEGEYYLLGYLRISAQPGSWSYREVLVVN